ncbi:succinate dehydrogenase, hydrophobic membrane anchor protein [Crenobacter oryzisoli]|uniref:succinate dehydrogenase, hydrophobic membrane anchor protein n=1 Tax=Crenobacter oryzisoli TaxID=3056844 RepID=UPI00338EE31F
MVCKPLRRVGCAPRCQRVAVNRVITGLHAWLLQRITAVYMLFFIPYLLIHFLLDPPHSYLAWRAWMGSASVSIATIVFSASLLLHAWIGIRDVVMDYVKPLALRLSALIVVAFGLAAVVAWTVRILLLASM